MQKLPLSTDYIRLSGLVQARFDVIAAAWEHLGEPLRAYYDFNGQSNARLMLERRRERMTSLNVLVPPRQTKASDVVSIAHLLMNFWNGHIVFGLVSKQLRETATRQYLNCALTILRHASGNEKVLEEITFFILQLSEEQASGKGASRTSRHLESVSREVRLILAHLRPALEMCFQLRDAIRTRSLEGVSARLKNCLLADPPSETLLGQWLDWVNASHYQMESRVFLDARRNVEIVLLAAASRNEGFSGWADLLTLKAKSTSGLIQIGAIDRACRKLDPAILEERERYLTKHPDVLLSNGRLGMVEYPNRVSLVFFGRMRSGKAVVLKQSYFVREATMLDAIARERSVYESLDVAFVPTVHSLERVGKSKFLLNDFVSGKSLCSRLGRSTPDQVKLWFKQLVAIVASLEKLQIVHGDISTQNVLVGRNGLYLIDFETATVASSSANLANSADRQRIEQIKRMLL